MNPKKKGDSRSPFFTTAQLFLVRFRRRLAAALREVVVRRERVRREHDAFRRNDERGVLALRFERLLEERALLALFRGDLVPGLQELDENVARGAQHAHAVLLLQLLQRVGILTLPL